MRRHLSGIRQASGHLTVWLEADRRRSRPIARPRGEELESRRLLSGDLALTADAQGAGFRLTTFATGFPERSDGVGPLGIVFPSGGVLVSDTPGNVRFFHNDTDGQDATAVPPVDGASYGVNHAEGMAMSNGNIYMSLGELNQVGLINPDGTLRKVVANIPNADGMTLDPLNGHLFVSGFGSSIYDVDPAAGTATAFLDVAADGLAFDPVAGILYAALYSNAGPGNRVQGFSVATKHVVFDSGTIPGGPDGIALGTGTLAGNLFVNTNGGTVVEVNLTTAAQTVIASGGTRGDFVTVDPNDGTLLVTQSDRIMRLAGPPGGGFIPTSSGLVSTTTTLVAQPVPSSGGTRFTLTAAVGTASSVAPTGTLTFTIDGVSQPPVAVAMVDGRAQASLTPPTLAAGTHTFTASYSGDAAFATSVSDPVQQVVKPPVTTPTDTTPAATTPAVTTPVADAVHGPRVVLLRRSRVGAHPTRLVLGFDQALALGSAQDRANYRISRAAGSGRVVRIRAAMYHPSARTVTLRLAHRINLHHPFRLTVVGTGPGGIATTSGIHLDGDGISQPGSDYIAVLSVADPVRRARGHGWWGTLPRPSAGGR